MPRNSTFTGVLLGTVAALALTAAPAVAGITAAEAILPPGQSGFVSAAGLADGTGSPHLYDQQQPFIDFRRKPFGFDQPAASTESPGRGVTITRDAFGVPNVRAGAELDAWYGAGYAVAQDRLFELEAFRKATQGRVAELTGRAGLGDDLVSRRDYYTPAEVDEQFERLPLPLRMRFAAYAEGVNAWIARVQLDPTLVPGEFVATGTQVTPFTTRDLTYVGIFLARTVPSGDGAELRNLRAIQDSGSPKVLDALVPLRVRGQRTTIPRSEGSFPQGPPLSAKKASQARRRSLRFVGGLPEPSAEQAGAAARKADLPAGRIGRTGGSYMFAIRKPGGGAVLFNGPQLGFSAPELFVELEVHAPGLDVRGVTAPGIPVIGIGHTDELAWGITSGLSDEDDLYAERLVPGEPEMYFHKGEKRRMDCRDETLRFMTGPSALLGGELPESGSKTERICRTVHGPVQARDGDIAYARRYAIWGREVETIVGIDMLNHAKTVADADRAARELTWNENLMAADSQGNIGYWHPGLLQIRPSKWDQRLPLPGTGEAEWPGLVPREKLPRVINPKQGWLANWNNVPSAGWTSGDGPASERISGGFHRVGWLQTLVAHTAKQDPSFAGAALAVRRAGSRAQQRPLAGPRLRRAARGATGRAREVLDTLLNWNGDYVAVNAENTVDAGVATWEAFKEEANRQGTASLGTGADRFEEKPGNSHVFDMTDREAYALRTLSSAGYRRVAEATFTRLADRFETTDTARWREPRAMYKIVTQGAEQPPPLPFFDRGTWEQIVELSP